MGTTVMEAYLGDAQFPREYSFFLFLLGGKDSA